MTPVLNIVSCWSDFTVSSIQSKSSLANLITRRHPIERKANTCSRRYARENQSEKDTVFDWLTTWHESDVRFLENHFVTEAVATLKNRCLYSSKTFAPCFANCKSGCALTDSNGFLIRLHESNYKNRRLNFSIVTVV